MVGTLLARKYRILRLLGAGGMGSVYEAQHQGTLRRVAVKVMNGRLLVSRGAGAHRFRREAKAAGTIESEHIVRILDSGDDESSGMLYLVMELLDGEDLQRLIDRLGPLAPDAALRIAVQALSGLERAHEVHVVHRDIKPANIFLARGRDGVITVKLLDFGIAKIKADTLTLPHTTGLTGTGSFLGSPLYMSPEQVESSRDVDHRSDLWSLGSALYCTLAGRAPHQSAASVSKLFVNICTVPVPPLSEVAPWVAREVAEAVQGALYVKPEERYPNATAMLEALRALLPDGFALREEMLVSVHGGGLARRSAPPRSELPAGIGEEEKATQNEGDSTVSLNAAPGGRASAQRLTTTGGQEAAPSPARGRWTAVLGPDARKIAVGAAIAVGTGAASYMAARTGTGSHEESIRASVADAPTEAPSTGGDPPMPAKTISAKAPETSPTLSYKGSLSAPSPRRVSLVIVPADALVEVDGRPVEVQGGTVTVSGVLGSGHRVRVAKGKIEVVKDVFVTDAGAVPSRLELPWRRPAAPARKPVPQTAASAAAKAPSPEDVLMPPVDP